MTDLTFTDDLPLDPTDLQWEKFDPRHPKPELIVVPFRVIYRMTLEAAYATMPARRD